MTGTRCSRSPLNRTSIRGRSGVAIWVLVIGAWASGTWAASPPMAVRGTDATVTANPSDPVATKTPTPSATNPAALTKTSRSSPTPTITPVPTTPKTATMGYVGCSMTMNAVSGYEAIGGTQFWPVIKYGGGGIDRWGKDLSGNSKYWGAFKEAFDANPKTHAIWWELCTLATDSTDDNYDHALIVLQEIKNRLPGAVVYVSAQPFYSSGHVCGIAGSDGPARMQSVADALVAEGKALKRPVMGPLLDSQLLPDGCHANTAGEESMGRQLMNHFGR